MKIFLMLLLAAAPARAEWGRAEKTAVAGLFDERAEISVISGAPLTGLLAARDKACQPLTLGGINFLATVVFDAEWNSWFVLKPARGLGGGAWKETDLRLGAVYKYGGLELRLLEKDGVVEILGPGEERAAVPVNRLFDRLYEDSLKITFGGAVTYSVFRNLAPLSEEEGTVTLRRDSDGLYYYSVTPDSLVAAAPRWLLAVNGVLYGLRVRDASLLFVSKPIGAAKPFSPAERSRRR